MVMVMVITVIVSLVIFVTVVVSFMAFVIVLVIVPFVIFVVVIVSHSKTLNLKFFFVINFCGSKSE